MNIGKARLQLTIWYTVIMMIITILFSVIIYGIQVEEVKRSVQFTRVIITRDIGFFPQPEQVVFLDETALDTARKNILRKLFVANLAILLITAGVAYFLAERTLQPIEQSIERQKHFISDASHEMRTPLTAMRTTLEVALRNKTLDSDSREALEETLFQSTRLQRLTDSLLNLSLLENTVIDAFSVVSLRSLLEDAVHIVSPSAQKKSITITLPDTDVSAYVHSGQITEVFTILFDNAIKYSPDHSAISVSWVRSHSRILVSVVDHGIGIPKDDLQHIFDRFYRSDKARHSQTGGYGLGLAIAKRIVELHRGSIYVHSEVGKGSTFTVELPCA